jgi:hypothetical protein
VPADLDAVDFGFAKLAGLFDLKGIFMESSITPSCSLVLQGTSEALGDVPAP